MFRLVGTETEGETMIADRKKVAKLPEPGKLFPELDELRAMIQDLHRRKRDFSENVDERIDLLRKLVKIRERQQEQKDKRQRAG